MIYVAHRDARERARLYISRAPVKQHPWVTLMGSNEPPIGEGDAAGFPHDEVVQHLDLDQGEGVPQAPGDQLVRLTGLGRAGWMIVGKDDRERVAIDDITYDLLRVDA